jgi:hypothetical protein
MTSITDILLVNFSRKFDSILTMNTILVLSWNLFSWGMMKNLLGFYKYFVDTSSSWLLVSIKNGCFTYCRFLMEVVLLLSIFLTKIYGTKDMFITFLRSV